MFEELGDLWRNVEELLIPEIVPMVAEQLDEGDNQTPRVWAMNQEPLKQDLGRDLLVLACVDLLEQMQNQRTEPMGMRIGVTQVDSK